MELLYVVEEQFSGSFCSHCHMHQNKVGFL